MTTDISNFDAMAGSGVLKHTAPGTGESTLAATLTPVSDLEIEGETGCQGLVLATAEETIVAVARCGAGSAHICPGGPQSCQGEFHDVTKRTDANKLERRSSQSDHRYQVEFHGDRFVYRIQKRNCLVRYRHGCLIPGLGYHDLHVYEFRRN